MGNATSLSTITWFKIWRINGAPTPREFRQMKTRLGWNTRPSFFPTILHRLPERQEKFLRKFRGIELMNLA